MKPHRIDAATRVSLVVLSQLFDWRSALVVVQPATLIRWRRAGWKLLWPVKSRRGRPPIPGELRALIRRIAHENFLWGEERIANELMLKLGIRVSPRTLRKYMPKWPSGQPRRDQRWSTFLKNHAAAILACDLVVAIAARFRMLISRMSAERILRICARGLEVLRSSIASADAMCGRVMGPVRREWLEAIPMPDAQSRPISRRLMACSDSTTRPRSAPNPRVRGPPRPPARVTGVRPWFCLGTDFVSDAVVCAKRCLTVGARYSLVPPRANARSCLSASAVFDLAVSAASTETPSFVSDGFYADYSSCMAYCSRWLSRLWLTW